MASVVIAGWCQQNISNLWITVQNLQEAGDTASTAAAKSLQLCLTLCDPRDGSPPGSPVRGIFQARVLEWGASAFSEQALKNPI